MFPTPLKSIAVAASLVLAGAASAQTATQEPLQNVAQLSATATIETRQDLLSISMTTTRDGPDASAVQSQLRQAVETALAQARVVASPGEMDVRTGNFSLYPRYGKDGKINGWQGSAELVLEGRDFARISATAGKLQTLTIGQVGFALSREQRARVETQAQALAVERFKARAAEVAGSFGFGSYSLREVSISSADDGSPPRPRMLSAQARASSADEPVPVEAGKASVVVTVSGSVQMK